MQQITADAAASPAVEVCGLLFGTSHAIQDARPCRNAAADPARQFELDPAALIAAHRDARAGRAQLVGHYHTHPTGPALPSISDAAAAASDGAIWIIVGADEVTAWRAVERGAHLGRFDPLSLIVVPAACAGPRGRSEGAPFEQVGKEASR